MRWGIKEKSILTSSLLEPDTNDYFTELVSSNEIDNNLILLFKIMNSNIGNQLIFQTIPL